MDRLRLHLRIDIISVVWLLTVVVAVGIALYMIASAH